MALPAVQDTADNVTVLGASKKARWRCAGRRHASPYMVALDSWRRLISRQSSREKTNVKV